MGGLGLLSKTSSEGLFIRRFVIRSRVLPWQREFICHFVRFMSSVNVIYALSWLHSSLPEGDIV